MLDSLKMFWDYSRSLEIQKLSAEEFHKEKGQSKTGEKNLPQSLACVQPPPPLKQNRGKRTLPDCFCLFVCFLFFLGQGEVNGRSLLIQSICVYLQIIFSVSECFPSPCLLWSHSFELKEISTDHWNCRVSVSRIVQISLYGRFISRLTE